MARLTAAFTRLRAPKAGLVAPGAVEMNDLRHIREFAKHWRRVEREMRSDHIWTRSIRSLSAARRRFEISEGSARRAWKTA
jgi:hypothetical protein